MKQYVVLSNQEILDVYGTPEEFKEALEGAEDYLEDTEHEEEVLYLLKIEKIIKRTSVTVEDFKEF